jgi:amidase
MAGDDPGDPACAPRPGFTFGAIPPAATPRLGVIQPYFFDEADAETAALTLEAIDKLAGQGATIVELPLPDAWHEVHAMHRRIYFAEAAAVHQRMHGAPRAGYGPKMAELLAEGFAVSMADYQAALHHQTGFRHTMARLLADVDAVITPATPGPAPVSLATTGDPRFNAPWSYAGTPTVSIPFALTDSGMPIALQLVGKSWSEPQLLSVAQWCEERLGFAELPNCTGS